MITDMTLVKVFIEHCETYNKVEEGEGTRPYLET
jgi:hypothetical protein